MHGIFHVNKVQFVDFCFADQVIIIMNKTIRSDGREIIFRVYRRCLLEHEAQNVLSDLDNVYQRTADMTGKSVSTIRRVVLEGDRNRGVFSTSEKHSRGRLKKDYEDFELCAIRRKVQYFYTVKKQVPTLRNLLPVVRIDLGFDGCREHLQKILIALGFKYKKCQSKRTALMERPYIAAKRAEYLKKIMNNRSLPEELRKDIVYLDESYIDQSYKLKKCWQSINVSGVKKYNASKGKRYIIVLAGSEKGLIPNALLIFTEANKNADYHSEMSKTNFTKWVEEKLIPNLPPASIVVLNNAPYHSVVLNKAPTSATKVAKIKEWLIQNKILFDETLKKPQLLMLVKCHKPEPKFEIDELLGAYGHTVVRLPPYHYDLNPIELIWGIAKHKIASQNVGSIDIKETAERAFLGITKEDWKNSCQHIIKIEKEYYERELTLYDEIERLVINLEDDSSSIFESEHDSDEFEASSSQNMDVEGLEYSDEDLLE